MNKMIVNEIKKNGVVFTPDDLGYFMSNCAFKYLCKNKDEELLIIEPSSGDGALALSLLSKLTSEGYSKIKLLAFDINNDFLISLKKKVEELFPRIELECRCEDFIEFAYNEDSIKADIVISNPPYVRTQNLDDKYIDFAKNELQLNGKIDLYQIFICCLKKVLKPDGIVSIVVSNKFLSNKTGRTLRKYIETNYSLKEIIDFGDTKLFSASVLPVVLIFKNSFELSTNASYISIYSTCSNDAAEDLFIALSNHSKLCCRNGVDYTIKYGSLISSDFNWSIETDDDSEFLKNVEKNTVYRFNDFAKIKVGIKTTADKVFISDKWDELGTQKPELLFPLITHRIAEQYFSKKETSYYVLYPYRDNNGKKETIKLDDYPLTKNYLYTHFDELDSRKYIKESAKEWFEIWVPHSPKQWNKTKIVFRDICEHPTFWLSESGDIVNGDCYWFDFKEKINKDLVFLMLGIANSSFIEKYYDIKFNNKLYSGRRRFMTQYVENFPIFNPESDAAKEIIKIIKKASITKTISVKDKEAINKLVFEGFNQKN